MEGEVERVQLMDAISKKGKAAVVKRCVPADLVEEILLRLPCKSLVRFKSVNKLIASFLRNPQFINEHRKRNMKPSHYLTWDRSNKTRLHLFSLNRDECVHVKTIATHKFGLVLSSSQGLVCMLGDDSKSIALLNPVSGKLAPLPDLPRPFFFLDTRIRPRRRPLITWRTNSTGFGFDLKRQKYKIVQFVPPLYPYRISRCYVLTVNGRRTHASSWRQIDISNYQTTFSFDFQRLPTYVNGVLYWEKVDYSRAGLPVDVFAFDLSTEKISVFESKSKFNKYRSGKHLTALEGKLCCIDCTPLDDMSDVMKIWKLSYDTGVVGNKVTWILSYKLDICGYSSNFLYPLYMDDEKRIICESSGDLYRYDIDSKSLQVYQAREKIEGVVYPVYSKLSTIHSETVVPIPSL